MVITNNIVLFDQVISAFKIGNTNIELSRTTHEKTYNDLICCTMLPKNTEICFIDDTEFMKMKQDKVYYIHPKAYIHPLNISIIIERWVKFGFKFSKLITSPTYWYNWFSLHKRNISSSIDDNEINILVTKKIMASIREFFILSTVYENKYYNYKHNISRKINNTKTFFPVIVEKEKEEPTVKEPIIKPILEEKIEEPILEEKIEEPILEEKIEEPILEEKEEPTVKPILEEKIKELILEEKEKEKEKEPQKKNKNKKNKNKK
jgi:hypothetical protein